jgi:hypothetical protein
MVASSRIGGKSMFDPIPTRPWADRPANPPYSHEAKVLLVRRLREVFAGRFGGAWLQDDEGGMRALFVAIVDLTPQDALIAGSAGDQMPNASPVRSVPASYTDEERRSFQETVRHWLRVNGVTGVGLESRPDLSKVVATVRADRPEVATALRSLLPSDALLVASIDPNAGGGHTLGG